MLFRSERETARTKSEFKILKRGEVAVSDAQRSLRLSSLVLRNSRLERSNVRRRTSFTLCEAWGYTEKIPAQPTAQSCGLLLKSFPKSPPSPVHQLDVLAVAFEVSG